MNSPLASEKRKREEAEELPVAKRGRGRPRKNPDATPPPPSDPNAPKRGRGRPRKNPDAAPPSPKDPNAPKRGRGRPRKNPDAPTLSKPAANGTGRGRGRPPKKTSSTPKEQDQEKATGSKPRGRPKKDASITEDIAATQTPKKRETAGTKSITLENVTGTYEIDCEIVVNQFDVTDLMELSITTLPHTDSALIAEFNLGIVEGVMLLAADEDTLQATREEIEEETITVGKKSKCKSPVLHDGTLYFAWRGENVSDSEIHHGKCGGQTGVLRFKDNKRLTFEAEGAFPALGSHCKFQGERTSDQADEISSSWNDFSEEAAEEANQARWN